LFAETAIARLSMSLWLRPVVVDVPLIVTITVEMAGVTVVSRKLEQSETRTLASLRASCPATAAKQEFRAQPANTDGNANMRMGSILRQ
jgi:hypothetical protein